MRAVCKLQNSDRPVPVGRNRLITKTFGAVGLFRSEDPLLDQAKDGELWIVDFRIGCGLWATPRKSFFAVQLVSKIPWSTLVYLHPGMYTTRVEDNIVIAQAHVGGHPYMLPVAYRAGILSSRRAGAVVVSQGEGDFDR